MLEGTVLRYLVLCLLPVMIYAEICTKEICEFELVLRQARTMVYKHPKKYYSVELNKTKLQVMASENNIGPDDIIGSFVSPDDVITGDGYRRTVVTINDQFPGPAIEVIEGAQVVVKVVNLLIREVVTIHWHGLHMHNTLWMDGVPMVTQCPIQAEQSFTYRFMASPVGTHWYHSHVTGQRIDGLYGMLIIHPRGNLPKVPEFPLMLGDWYHMEGHTIEIISPSSQDKGNKGTGEHVFVHPSYRDYSHDGVNNAALVWESGLINGRGRHGDKKFPLTKFHVKRGTTYRFRMVNVGAEFSLRISIDHHVLHIIASDGHALEPFEVDYIIINPGETVDFEMKANQIEGRYWLRAETPHDYSTYKTHDGKVHDVRAVVVYEHIADDADPTSEPSPCTMQKRCRIFNCQYGSFPPSYNMTCINLDQVTSVMNEKQMAETYGVGDTDIYEIFMNLAYLADSSINARSMVTPDAPLFQRDAKIIECSDVCTNPDEPCICTHIVKIPYNKTIQIVFTNYQDVSYVGHHPVHVHGHTFAVMHFGFANHDPVTGRWTSANEDIKCTDSICSQLAWDKVAPTFKNKRPALKDTVNIPARGYTVIRMKSLNPGYWFVHCHMNHHLKNGMSALIEEAVDHIKPPPPHMPTCHSFSYSEQQFVKQKNRKAGNFFLDDSMAITPKESPEQKKPEDLTGDKEKEEMCTGEHVKEGFMTMRVGDVVGMCIGCIALGFVITVIPLLIYVKCGRQDNEKDPPKTRF